MSSKRIQTTVLGETYQVTISECHVASPTPAATVVITTVLYSVNTPLLQRSEEILQKRIKLILQLI